MKRVFVANRGEIAVRIVRACRALGLECVVGTSDVDRDGMAARLADRAVTIGPGPAGQSYLRPELVVHAALGTGCDAIHPGYGFLSESPALARLAREQGLTFVGPPTEVIELTGDKLRARDEARRAGVPVLSGHDVGFPVLIKAVGGGGGRGIKLAHDEDELQRLRSLARSEAGSAFGDDRVYLERFVEAARHIEVQIAADDHGAVVHLGERDCTVQRRYQKVIEEAPGPTLSETQRSEITEAAVRLARALGYRNLGTVEFVLDAETGEFFFLEVNCRIQVEHPVTEAITERDLVALQLRIAEGEPLGFTQDEVVFNGHAIECRLNAEAAGTISAFAVPEVDGLRVDTHCAPGAAVPPYYDSLLAKLIAHADDRETAIAVMLEALDRLEVDGVATNRGLLTSVLGHPDFAGSTITTDWLTRVAA
jgi:acetyl-CoA carboxylase, biotin carboxylase subunit